MELVFLFLLHQRISGRDDESERKNGHNENLPDFHFIEAQDEHQGDDEEDDVEEMTGNDVEFSAFFFFLSFSEPTINQSQKQNRRQEIFRVEVGTDNARKDNFRDKEKKIGDEKRNEKIF